MFCISFYANPIAITCDMKIKVFIFLLLSLSLLFLGVSNNQYTTNNDFEIKQKGVCWVGSRRNVAESEFEELAKKNVQWISQTPFGWQSAHDTGEISLGWRGSDNTSERDQGIIRTTRLAKKYGIKTILKPHIWLRNADTHWRGDIAMSTEVEWEKWFENYEKFILHYARLAQQEGIEILCIGTELHQTCQYGSEQWESIIYKIRNIYSGKLTYAANFNEEYEDVEFWSLLDYIGIQAYFPLSKSENPTLDELKKGWIGPIEQLREFSLKHDKPILFTEVGYKSTKDAAISPWVWPQNINREQREAIYSEKTQADCYEAMFQTVWKEPWLAGIYLWKWYPGFDNIRPRGNRSEKELKNYFNIDFTPQNKEAEEVMERWFGDE